MTILHVTKKFPNALGGDAVVVSNLRKQQTAAGHRVVIVTSNCDEIPDAPDVYKIGWRDTPAGLDAITPRRLVSLLALRNRIPDILRTEQPDIIHTHSIDMAFAVAPEARRRRIPLVHTFHIVTFHDANQSLLRRKAELQLANFAEPARITAPNDYDATKLRDAGLSQTRTVPNGVDLSFWQPVQSGKRSDYFLAVGRLEQQKGLEYLIEAAAKLMQVSTKPFRVLIVGTGSQEAALREEANNRGVGNVVQFLGQQDPQIVRDLLAQAAAFVLSSNFETTPLTLLEAWATGTPVIATPVGILQNQPDDFAAARLVPLHDTSALADAMRELLANDSAQQKLVTNGLREVKQYAWPTIAEQFEALYGALV